MRTPLIDSAETVAATLRAPKQRPAEDSEQLTSTLIEFPGSRNTPEWRKRLSQRVREIQEQKAREAAEEQAAHRAAEAVSCSLPSGQLELVPEPEQAPLNPIVTKALERVDRARRGGHLSTGITATAAAPALSAITEQVEPENSPIEAKPKLTIVAPLTIDAVAPPVTETVASEVPSAPAVYRGESDIRSIDEPEKRKRVRVISESVEEAALSYLETCLNVPVLAAETQGDAVGLGRRTIVGIFDLILIALMISPAAAAIQLAGSWHEPRAIGLFVAVSVLAIFAYMTLTIALTGRTLSMRMWSVKTIDARTGLIPTGGQSIKRALAYLFSLGIFGLGLAFAFIDRDHRTLHDRFSKTLVVRA